MSAVPGGLLAATKRRSVDSTGQAALVATDDPFPCGVESVAGCGYASPDDVRRRTVCLNDAQLQARATIAAALIQSRAIDVEALASLHKDISHHKLVHLRDLTERIYTSLATPAST